LSKLRINSTYRSKEQQIEEILKNLIEIPQTANFMIRGVGGKLLGYGIRQSDFADERNFKKNKKELVNSYQIKEIKTSHGHYYIISILGIIRFCQITNLDLFTTKKVFENLRQIIKRKNKSDELAEKIISTWIRSNVGNMQTLIRENLSWVTKAIEIKIFDEEFVKDSDLDSVLKVDISYRFSTNKISFFWFDIEFNGVVNLFECNKPEQITIFVKEKTAFERVESMTASFILKASIFQLVERFMGKIYFFQHHDPKKLKKATKLYIEELNPDIKKISLSFNKELQEKIQIIYKNMEGINKTFTIAK